MAVATASERKTCMPTAASSTRTQVDKTNAAFVDAFRRGDAAGLAAVYTTGGRILPPGTEPQTGAQAIQRFWQTVLDMGIVEASLETVELEEHGDLAWEVGKFTLKGKDGSLVDQGKYIVVWKQENGAWKWHRDIWNTSRPS
jgi:ketosteroid isomerase-like protein